MTDEIGAACDGLREILTADVEGLKLAPQYPPGEVFNVPVLLVQPLRGDWSKDSSKTGRGLDVLQIGCYTDFKDPATADRKIRPFGSRIRDALMKDANTDADTSIDHIVWPASYTYGAVDYGAARLFGWTIEITVKIRMVEQSDGTYNRIG